MNKKLLMLLFAGFSFVMLPACGDDEEEPKQEQNSGLQMSELAGAYHGDLTTEGTVAAENLGVAVENAGENKIKLALEPIEIMGITIDQLSFSDINCVYNASEDVWNFSAEGLHVQLMDGAIEADVDVKSGKFSKGGKLDFTVNVKSGMLDLMMDYAGKK